MNRLTTEQRAQLVSLLVEGNSIRATSRISGIAFNTVLKFVADIGRACTDFQDRTIRNVKAKRVQADEIWEFCYALICRALTRPCQEHRLSFQSPCVHAV